LIVSQSDSHLPQDILGRMARLTVVSDSHLSTRTPEADENWTAVLQHVLASRPDLVIHAGDLSLDKSSGSRCACG